MSFAWGRSAFFNEEHIINALLPIVVLPLMILAKYLKDNKKTIFEKISKLKIWIKVVAGVLIVGFVGVCMVYVLRIYSNLTLPENINNSVIPWNGENGYTVGYFLKNPFALASIFINTVWMKSDGYLVGLLGGNLGWLNIPIPYIFIIPYVKQTTNGNLPYDSSNSNRGSVTI